MISVYGGKSSFRPLPGRNLGYVEPIGEHLVIYDRRFKTQAWLSKNCKWLAETKVVFDGMPGVAASVVIDHYAKWYKVNARWILTRMHIEHSIFSGKVEGKWYVYPWVDPATGRLKRDKLTKVLNRICGYGMSYRTDEAKFYGFEKQVRLCARKTREDFKRMQYVPYMLSSYTPEPGIVEGYAMIWKKYFRDF